MYYISGIVFTIHQTSGEACRRWLISPLPKTQTSACVRSPGSDCPKRCGEAVRRGGGRWLPAPSTLAPAAGSSSVTSAMKSASAAPSAEQAAADRLHRLQPPADLASQLASAHAQQQALQQQVQSQQQQLQAQAQQSQRELRASRPPPPQQASPPGLQAQTSGRSSGALVDLGVELDSGALGGGRWDSGARQRRRRAAWTIQSCVLKRQASAALHLGGLGLGLGLG